MSLFDAILLFFGGLCIGWIVRDWIAEGTETRRTLEEFDRSQDALIRQYKKLREEKEI